MEIRVPNKFVALWLSENYSQKFLEAIHSSLKLRPTLRFVHPEPRPVPSTDVPCRPASLSDMPPTYLNSSATFGNFVRGRHNRFAYASSLNVANHPGDPYNPLYIYGRMGLGKTHLLNAIGNHVLAAAHGPVRVEYMSAERFSSLFSAARKNRIAHPFAELDDRLDLLLFDNIHELAGWRTTQGAFLFLFNRFLDTNRQVVIAGSHPPSQIRNLLPELQSRLQSGLLSEVGAPDQETKIRILRQKAKEDGIAIEDDVALFLASNTTDFKAAHRLLIGVQAHLSLTGGEIDLPSVKRLLMGRSRFHIRVQDIQRSTADFFHIPIPELTSNKKHRRYSYPRQLAMYLTRKLTDLSLKQIAEAFGKKDHTTILYAINRIDEKTHHASSTVSDHLSRIQALLM